MPEAEITVRRRRGLRLERSDATVVVALTLIFVMRWVLSGNQSYWLDEMLSVVRYGIDNKSGYAAAQRLAGSSIHPPLYQLILYYWMKVAGDQEVATRFLSNLYVTGASICLYLTVRDAMGRRRALVASIGFSLMYVPFYYAMETRSYGQSLFLSALSSLALFRFMRVLATASSFKEVFVNRAYALLLFSNFCLLMTHYFNVLFLGSQAAFVLAWTLWHAWRAQDLKLARLAARIARAALPLMSPLLLLLVAWGPVMARTYKKHGSKFGAKGLEGPWVSFWEQAVRPSFVLPWVLLVALAGLLIWFYAAQARAAHRTRTPYLHGQRALAAYALAIAFGPFVIAFVLFSLSRHEGYADRYFAFTAPGLAIMLVLAIEQAVALLHRIAPKLRPARHYLESSGLATLLAVALVLPGTYKAANTEKADWRGTAQLVANITRDDPGHKYLVYSTGFTSFPNLDYYFKRFGSKLRVREYIRQRQDKRPTIVSAQHRKDIERHDFLILTFTHLKEKKFPKTLKAVNEVYEVHQRIMENGRGIIIYRAKPTPKPKPDVM